MRVHVLSGQLDAAEADLGELKRLSGAGDTLLGAGRFWIALGGATPRWAVALAHHGLVP